VRSLVKDLASILPEAVRLTRGHMSMRDLAREAEMQGADRVVIVAERKGNPGIIRVYKPADDDLVNIVSFIVKGVALSRELRRGLPREPVKSMLVEPRQPGLPEEFADAFIIAFHAQTLDRDPGPRDIVASIDGLTEDSVKVEFEWRGRPVGPRLKLGKPARMVKRENL